MNTAQIGPILRPAWYCPACGEWWDCEAAAVDCCQDGAEFAYPCPTCELPHPREAEALACCGWEQTPEGARAIRTALDEAGQLPLEL